MEKDFIVSKLFIFVLFDLCFLSMFVFVMMFSVLFLFGVGMFLNFFMDEDYLLLIFGIFMSWFAGYAIFYNLNLYYSNFDSVSHSKVMHWESCLELSKSDCCVKVDWKHYCLVLSK